MRIDHIGYAVKNIEKASVSFEKLGFTFEPVIEDADRNVYLRFGVNGSTRVELVSPMKEGSPADEILHKNGPTPYHLCYVSDDLEADIASLEKERFKVIIPPARAVAFGGKRVVFMMNLAIGMIEIVER